MNLLDEWKVPEPSPYWEVRMQARLREEQQKAASGWLQWLRVRRLAWPPRSASSSVSVSIRRGDS